MVTFLTLSFLFCFQGEKLLELFFTLKKGKIKLNLGGKNNLANLKEASPLKRYQIKQLIIKRISYGKQSEQIKKYKTV